MCDIVRLVGDKLWGERESQQLLSTASKKSERKAKPNKRECVYELWRRLDTVKEEPTTRCWASLIVSSIVDRHLRSLSSHQNKLAEGMHIHCVSHRLPTGLARRCPGCGRPSTLLLCVALARLEATNKDPGPSVIDHHQSTKQHNNNVSLSLSPPSALLPSVSPPAQRHL